MLHLEFQSAEARANKVENPGCSPSVFLTLAGLVICEAQRNQLCLGSWLLTLVCSRLALFGWLLTLLVAVFVSW